MLCHGMEKEKTTVSMSNQCECGWGLRPRLSSGNLNCGHKAIVHCLQKIGRPGQVEYSIASVLQFAWPVYQSYNKASHLDKKKFWQKDEIVTYTVMKYCTSNELWEERENKRQNSITLHVLVCLPKAYQMAKLNSCWPPPPINWKWLTLLMCDAEILKYTAQAIVKVLMIFNYIRSLWENKRCAMAIAVLTLVFSILQWNFPVLSLQEMKSGIMSTQVLHQYIMWAGSWYDSVPWHDTLRQDRRDKSLLRTNTSVCFYGAMHTIRVVATITVHRQ